MQISQLEGYGIPVWCPVETKQNLLATGTFSHQESGKESFLRICNYDITQGIQTIGSTLAPSRFASLDWTDSTTDYGLIAGGLEDGAITLWDPKKIIQEGAASSSN